MSLQKVTWPHEIDAPTFFGNPDSNGDGSPDTAWEGKNIRRLAPPYAMRWSWAPHDPVRYLRVHATVYASLNAVLLGIKSLYGTQAEIEARGLHWCGGAYNFRPNRNDPRRLSLHSYGAAIDLDPEHNPNGRAWLPDHGMMPREVIDLFESAGWQWGGRYRHPDPMHFQACIS